MLAFHNPTLRNDSKFFSLFNNPTTKLVRYLYEDLSCESLVAIVICLPACEMPVLKMAFLDKISRRTQMVNF